MANGTDTTFFGRVGDILTGGLEAALNIEVSERLNNIIGGADDPRGEVDRAVSTGNNTVARAGQPVSMANPPRSPFEVTVAQAMPAVVLVIIVIVTLVALRR